MEIIKRLRLLAIIIVLLYSTISGQTYRFIDYKKQQLFDQSQIVSITQDSWGFMWFGTGNGLFRYDGEDWIKLSIENGLPDNEITAIAEDDSLRLWIGTGYGLACVNIRDYNNPTLCDSAACLNFQHQVYAMTWWNNTLWLGTASSGLYRVKNHKIYPPKKSIALDAPNVIYDFSIIDEDRLGVVIPDSGYFIIDGNGNISAKFSEFKGDLAVSVCSKNNGDDILIGGSHGLYRIDAQNGHTISVLPNEIRNKKPYFLKLVYDKDGIAWGATDRGLLRYDGQQTELITTENGLPSQILRTLSIDRENNIWIGSYSSGLFKLSNRDMLVYDEAGGLESGVVNAILAETKQRKLLGTDAGVFKIENKKLVRDKRFRDLDNSVIWNIYHDRQKRIWLTGENFTAYYDRGKLHKDPYPEVSSDAIVLDMLQDSQGRLWFGTTKGLYLISQGKLEAIQEYNSIKIRNVIAITESREGAVYFGNGLGLLVRHQKGLNYYTKSNGLPVRAINEIFQASNGTIWLGSDHGLIKMVGDSFTVYNRDNGFKGLVITQIMEDSKGYLWICTEGGLHQFDGEKVTAVINRHDGLVGDEFVTRNSSLIDDDEILWLGLFGGLSIVEPEKVLRAPHVNPTLLLKKANAYSLSNEIISFDKTPQVCIPYDKKNIIFDFTGLYFRSEQDLGFNYRLQGMDNQWQTIGRAGEVRYHGLWPGSYQLEVHGIIDNKITGNPIVMPFEIGKPFWMEIWFITLVAVLSIIGINYIIILRVKKIRRTQVRLERQIQNRTNELVRTKAKFENIIEHAGSAIVTTDLKGKIKTWNKRAESLFGFSKKEMMSQWIGKLDLAGDNYPFDEILNETENAGEMNQLELKKRARDGNEIELMLTTTYLKEEGTYTIVMEDFTARNQLMQSMINREKLLGAIGGLNQLLATLSHYINNSLMAISGMSQLAQMDKKYIDRLIETSDNQSIKIKAVLHSLADLVHSLNLKTKNYVGDEPQLFDIESDIERYIEMIRHEDSKSSSLTDSQVDRNDVY